MSMHLGLFFSGTKAFVFALISLLFSSELYASTLSQYEPTLSTLTPIGLPLNNPKNINTPNYEMTISWQKMGSYALIVTDSPIDYEAMKSLKLFGLESEAFPSTQTSQGFWFYYKFTAITDSGFAPLPVLQEQVKIEYSLLSSGSGSQILHLSKLELCNKVSTSADITLKAGENEYGIINGILTCGQGYSKGGGQNDQGKGKQSEEKEGAGTGKGEDGGEGESKDNAESSGQGGGDDRKDDDRKDDDRKDDDRKDKPTAKSGEEEDDRDGEGEEESSSLTIGQLLHELDTQTIEIVATQMAATDSVPDALIMHAQALPEPVNLHGHELDTQTIEVVPTQMAATDSVPDALIIHAQALPEPVDLPIEQWRSILTALSNESQDVINTLFTESVDENLREKLKKAIKNTKESLLAIAKKELNEATNKLRELTTNN